jgi:hypothetical protein
MTKLVVLVSGKKRSGKDTFASLLIKRLHAYSAVSVERLMFAGPLKETCESAFTPMTQEINARTGIIGKLFGLHTNHDHWWDEKNIITRHILQRVGTDICRSIDDEIWTKKTVARINASPATVFVVTDWRFPNELVGLQKYFGGKIITIRITRNSASMNKSLIAKFIAMFRKHDSTSAHISETALDSAHMDYEITNDRSLAELDLEAVKLASMVLSSRS